MTYEELRRAWGPLVVLSPGSWIYNMVSEAGLVVEDAGYHYTPVLACDLINSTLAWFAEERVALLKRGPDAVRAELSALALTRSE